MPEGWSICKDIDDDEFYVNEITNLLTSVGAPCFVSSLPPLWRRVCHRSVMLCGLSDSLNVDLSHVPPHPPMQWMTF